VAGLMEVLLATSVGIDMRRVGGRRQSLHKSDFRQNSKWRPAAILTTNPLMIKRYYTASTESCLSSFLLIIRFRFYLAYRVALFLWFIRYYFIWSTLFLSFW